MKTVIIKGGGSSGAKALTPRYKAMPIGQQKVKVKKLSEQQGLQRGKHLTYGGGEKHPHKLLVAETHTLSNDRNGDKVHVRMDLKCRH